MELITQSNVIFTIGILSGLYAFFKLVIFPQKQSKAKDQLDDQKAKFLRSEYDKKFVSLDERLAEVTKNNQNHLHTIDTKLDALTKMIVDLGKDVIRLETTLNIKLPK